MIRAIQFIPPLPMLGQKPIQPAARDQLLHVCTGASYQGHLAIFIHPSEPSPIVFQELKQISLKMGFSVTLCQHPDGLNSRPDLLLLDWSDYQKRGQELRGHFKSPFTEELEAIPVLLLYPGPKIATQLLEEVLETGVREVIHTPVRARELGLRINRLLKEQALYRKELEAKAAAIKSLNLIIQKISIRMKSIRKNLQFLRHHPGIGEHGNEIHRLCREINRAIPSERTWKEHDRQIHFQKESFKRHLKILHPGLTSSELEYCHLVKLRLSRKEAADLLDVSQAAIEKKRYRIKQKIRISGRMSLEQYFERID